MKIVGAVLEETGHRSPYAVSAPLRLRELDLDPPGAHEVLVRMEVAGLCHSDLSVIDGNRPRPLPMLLGHEAAGIVEECGELVAGIDPGDRVVMTFLPRCGECAACATGGRRPCQPGSAANGRGELLAGGRRVHRDGMRIHHHLGVSAFSEYVTVSRRSLVKVDKELRPEHAALFGCAVLTGVGAVVNTAKISAGSTVSVVGLGGVGLASLLGAIAAGASTIVAVDLSDERLGFARELGATHAFNAKDPDCVDAIRSVTGGGTDFAFELAGSVRAMETAYKITRRGGTTVTAGLPPPDAMFSFPQVGLVAEERTVKGSYIGACVPVRDIPRYVSLFQRGRLPVDRLLSSTLGLDEINSGFDRLQEGSAIRQVVLF